MKQCGGQSGKRKLLLLLLPRLLLRLLLLLLLEVCVELVCSCHKSWNHPCSSKDAVKLASIRHHGIRTDLLIDQQLTSCHSMGPAHPQLR
jgi:putative lipase involved disintegration of autophagic bodies